MTVWGVVFMAVTWAVILFLLVFTYSRILKNREKE